MNAPIIVTALLGAADARLFDDLRREHFPPERNHLSAHLTMFHHLPPSSAAELMGRLKAEARGPAPEAQTVGVLDLGGGTAVRVSSPALAAIRTRIAGAFAGSLTPQDAGGWRPHVTIQNKVARADAVELQRSLADRFDRRPIAIAGLAAWWYRGGPWEPLGEARFRG